MRTLATRVLVTCLRGLLAVGALKLGLAALAASFAVRALGLAHRALAGANQRVASIEAGRLVAEARAALREQGGP